MVDVVNNTYTFIALVMLGGYALFAFTVAYMNKSRRACMCGLVLIMLIVFFSGCASNPYGALYQRDTKACGLYAVAKAANINGKNITNEEVERVYNKLSGGLNTASMDMATAFNVATEAGWIDGSMGVFTMVDIKLGLERGALVLYLPVYSGGLPSQFWKTEGTYEGTHCIACEEFNDGLFKLINSYGPNWGSNGRAWLWEDGLEEMIEDGRARAWVVK